MTAPVRAPSALSSDSVRSHIRESIVYGLKNNIKIDRGYRTDVKEVYNESPTLEEIKEFPAIDVITGDDAYENIEGGGHSSRVLIKRLTVLISCYLHSNVDMKLAQDRMIADLEDYFMTYPYAPDAINPDVHWARECMFRSARPFGLETNKPNGGVDVEIVFFYGQQIDDARIPA